MKVMRDQHYSANKSWGVLSEGEEEYGRTYKKKKTDQSDFSQFLPNELVLEIFNFLGCEQSAAFLLPVCKQFYAVGSDYPPIQLLSAVKQMRTKEWSGCLPLSVNMRPTDRLQKQFATMIASFDKGYQGTQNLLELTPCLRSNFSFTHLVENNRYLFESLVKSNGMMLKYRGSSLERDLPILQSGVQANKLAFEFVPDDLKPKIQETVYREIHLYHVEERLTEGASREPPQWMAQYTESKDVFEELDQWINE